jgi:hypothetical protein
MANSVNQKDVEAVVRGKLKAEGYSLSSQRKNGETGADIIARKPGNSIAVECIGFQDNRPSRSKVFYEAFFRAISRLQGEINEIVIALPLRFKDGLPKRARQHGVGWDKIGKAFPELKLWLVDVERKKITERQPWSYWKGCAN